MHAKYATTLLRLLYGRSLQNRSGHFRVGGRNRTTLASSAMRPIGHLRFSTVLVLRPHFTFVRTSYVFLLVCFYLFLRHHCHVFRFRRALRSETFFSRVLFYSDKTIWHTVERFGVARISRNYQNFICNISGVDRNQFTPKFVIAHHRTRDWALTRAPG